MQQSDDGPEAVKLSEIMISDGETAPNRQATGTESGLLTASWPVPTLKAVRFEPLANRPRIVLAGSSRRGLALPASLAHSLWRAPPDLRGSAAGRRRTD